MERENPEIDALIVKQLNGTLSAEEQIRLEKLLRENGIAQKQYDHFNKLWKTSGNLRVQPGLSRDMRWSNLKERIEADLSPDSRFSLRIILRYAAIFAGVGLVALLYLVKPSSALVEIKTAYGETRIINLPDSSLVTLNAGTTLRYDPSSWNEERKLELNGEAFFEVQKNGVPFMVASNSAYVRVLGTSFNVRAWNAVTDVTCLTGKVSVSNKTGSAQSVVLTQGLGVTVDSLAISEIYNVASDRVAGWMQGDLHFVNTPLKEVFIELERHFNKPISLKREIGTQTFTGWFKEPRLINTLETICLSAGLTYSVQPDSTIVIQ